MKKGLFIFFLSLIPFTLFSQVKTINGRVIDETTLESVIGALVNLNAHGSITNNYGFFSVKIPTSDSLKIQVQSLGYKEYLSESNSQNTFLTISLIPDTTSLDEIIITGDKIAPPQTGLDHITLSQKELLQMPSFMGEPDVFKALQSLPGIQFGKEGNSGLYVRGGTPDQNLILLDDVPLYSVNHLGGFFSVFEPYAIKTMSVHTGAFPARYSGRISSVLDIRIKEADKTNFQSRYRLGILSSSANLDIPITKEKSSILVSARRGNIDLITRPLSLLSSNGTYQAGYTFYDAHIKYHNTMSEQDQLSLNLYWGNDAFFSRGKDSQNEISDEKLKYHYRSYDRVYWNNLATSVKWTHQFNNGWFLSHSPAISRFQYNIDSFSKRRGKSDSSLNNEFDSNFSSGLTDLLWRTQAEYNSIKHNINGGLMVIQHLFRPGLFTATEKTPSSTFSEKFGSQNQTASEWSLYIEDRFQPNEIIALSLGINSTIYTINQKSYKSIQPRVSAITYINQSSFGASYSEMMQSTHLLTNNGTGVPIDLWVPATDSIPPIHSTIWSLDYSFNTPRLEIKLAAYMKQFKNLIDFKNGSSFLGGGEEDWQSKVESKGIGHANGIEFQLKKITGNTTGWLSYTLSKNQRKFKNINNGMAFPFRYDRRHQISILLNSKLSDKLDISSSWTYHSGDAITLALEKYYIQTFAKNGVNYDYGPHEAHLYSSRNQYRLPPYHRLDLSLNSHKQQKRSTRTFSVGIYNVYLRKNPYFVYFDQNEKGEAKLYQVSLFPFMPSVSWSWQF